ncbi:hypothetical protein FACS189475_02130 [Betaproteobacteria bacterium]|nr:hypothetical protein FACS189475_02130 [Betaproteobacteria bacterium]
MRNTPRGDFSWHVVDRRPGMMRFLRKNYVRFITSDAQIITLVAQPILLFIVLLSGSESRGIWFVFLVLLMLVDLFAWMSTMRRRRAIMDTPASRIASAAQGYVELFGVGRPIDKSPPLTRRTNGPCLWRRFQVEKKTFGRWKIVERGESDAPFIIDDGSGRCRVEVQGAEILIQHKDTWVEGKYRYTEWKLLNNDSIYAIGEFRTIDGGSVDLDARRDMNELLNQWKKDKKKLLERFDLDKDGELDEKEWDLARQAARREVSRMHIEARNASDVHTLRCPDDGRHYLLANTDPKKFASYYLVYSLLHLFVFLGVLYMIGMSHLRFF